MLRKMHACVIIAFVCRHMHACHYVHHDCVVQNVEHPFLAKHTSQALFSVYHRSQSVCEVYISYDEVTTATQPAAKKKNFCEKSKTLKTLSISVGHTYHYCSCLRSTCQRSQCLNDGHVLTQANKSWCCLNFSFAVGLIQWCNEWLTFDRQQRSGHVVGLTVNFIVCFLNFNDASVLISKVVKKTLNWTKQCGRK